MKKQLLSVLLSAAALCSQAQQWNGLTYYSNSGSSNGYLIDTNNVTIKTYTFNIGTGYSTHFTPGGNFVRSTQNPGNILTGGGMTGRMQKLDYNGNLLWDWTYSSSTYCLHHDHCVMPNGNILVICYDVRNATDLANAGSTSTLTSIRSEKIMELQPVGNNSVNVIWEWYLWDHTVQNVDNTKSNYQASIVDHPELMNINYLPKNDWWHMNGIDYNPMTDQIVVSSHNMNEWYIIDHSTSTAEAAAHTGGKANRGGDFLYRWGNPAAYQASGPTILNVTHDAHWVPQGCPGAGNLSGVNNRGVTSPSNRTCIDMLTPPKSSLNYTIAPGSAFTPSTYAYRHQSSSYTSNMGSVDEFPNGNRMVCLAMVGSIYEIDAAGNTLWTKTTSGACPQSHRYTTCYLNNPAPGQPSISLSGNDLVSTSATTYQWYVDGDLIPGATSQTYTPLQNGYYVVRTTDANGCVYVYSPLFQVSGMTGMKKDGTTGYFINIFPNPSLGKFNIELSFEAENISIYDMNGKQVITGFTGNSFEMERFPTGIYTVKIAGKDASCHYRKLSLIK